MRAKYKLTDNALLYISVGFRQSCLLQVLSIRPGPLSSLQMIVYDGIVYSGAIYRPSINSKREAITVNALTNSTHSGEEESWVRQQGVVPRQYDIIRVSPMLAGRNEPLLIDELEVVSRNETEIMGRDVLSLEQYMRRRNFLKQVQIEEEQQERGQPNKKIKSISSFERLSESEHQKIEGNREQVPFELEQRSVEQDQPEDNQENKGQFLENSKNSLHHSSLRQNQLEKQKSNSFTSNVSQKKLTASVSFEKLDSKKSQNSQSKQYGIIPNIPEQEKSNQSSSNKVFEEEKREEQKSKSKSNIIFEEEEKKQQQEKIKSQKLQNNGPPHEIIELLMEQDKEIPELKGNMKKKKNIIDLISDEPYIPTKKSHTQSVKIEKTTQKAEMLISDLYERMYRFRILCRINNISHFTSQKGHPCTKLNLIDQKGNQILCMLFDKSSDNPGNSKVTLTRGKTYYFENGEVSQEEGGIVQLSVPWSGIEETKYFLQSFEPGKMMRVGQLQKIEANHFFDKVTNNSKKSINNKKNNSKELHVCGIFNGFKDQPKLTNNRFRIVGILCDPDQCKSVNFCLFLDELSIFPKSGAVISLHNVHLCEHEKIYRLQSSKRSYYLVENHNDHPYFSDLVEASKKETWKLNTYKNLSEVSFITRTIAQIQQLLSHMLEQDHCHSEVDCNIASVSERRQYPACVTCHHELKGEKAMRTYCHHCKRIENVSKRFIFNSEVADSTGSIHVKIYPEEIEPFINTTPENYSQMCQNDRNAILELSSLQNITLKLKSQQQVGGANHVVIKAEKNNYKKSLEQIKEKSISARTTYQAPWN